MNTIVSLVKSFTKDSNAGSPTGVILEADSLSDEQMQTIALKLDFPETMFVLSSRKADLRIRYFAPKQEVNLCGHGTIATFHLLLSSGQLSLDGEKSKDFTLETLAGQLIVTCNADGQVTMTQNDPIFGDIEDDRKKVAKLIGVSEEDIGDLPMQVVSTGTPKLLIPLKNSKALRAVNPDLEGIKEYCLATGARGFYPFTLDSPFKGTDFFARQFNPLADDNEDPLTGVAAGALGCYTKRHKLFEKQTFVVAQGYDLGMGGTIYVDVSSTVKVGGYAVSYGTKALEF